MFEKKGGNVTKRFLFWIAMGTVTIVASPFMALFAGPIGFLVVLLAGLYYYLLSFFTSSSVIICSFSYLLIGTSIFILYMMFPNGHRLSYEDFQILNQSRR